MNQIILNKYEALKQNIREYDSVAVAFSGGVDSTLLLKIAHDVLGEEAVAVTARSRSFPQRELEESVAFCQAEGIKQYLVDINELSLDAFVKNPPERCYICKKEIFSKLSQAARDHGISWLIEGSNTDDRKDYRPGHRAIQELGVRSPLEECDLSKSEVRTLSKMLELPTWDKPSFACLASRIPYGDMITAEKLSMIDQAEAYLMSLGFHQLRVRHHGTLARIETDEAGFEKITDRKLREQIYDKLRAIGYDYIAVDLLGYRTGSMNETLSEQ